MAAPKTPPKRPVVKAKFFTNELTALMPTNVVEDTTGDTAVFRGTQAITPPYDLDECAAYLDMSSALRTNVDAYASNIDSYGHTFEPVIDLEDEAAIEVVRQAILEERLERRLESEGPDRLAKALVELAQNGGEALKVTDAEVQQQIDDLRVLMAIERRRLEFFFNNCTVEGSFIHLRRITRQDYETLGNAYWEILRDDHGQPAQFNLIPGLQVRLTPRLVAVEVTRPATRSLLHQDTITQPRTFRQFIQVLRNNVRSSGTTAIGGQLVYFKEFGDPRLVSSASGEIYTTPEAMQKAEPGARAATEVIHWKIYSPMSPYGIPRWVSEMMNLLGTRHAQTVNYLYFENKSIPPLAILVSGGSLAPESVNEIRNFIDNEIKGARNFHKIMILEAQSDAIDAGGGGSVRVEIKPLTDAMIQDAMFLQYMDKNVDNLGKVFRNPRIVRGDTADVNRATAEAAIRLAEQQVYQPERNEFDWRINHEILPQLGIRFWKFVSRGPDMTDPQELAKMLADMAEAGPMTIAEMRRIAEKVFGVTLPVWPHWANNVPMRVFRSHQESLRFGGVEGLPTGGIPLDPNKQAALELKKVELKVKEMDAANAGGAPSPAESANSAPPEAPKPAVEPT
ncbi:MAG: phage portal protein [Hyphomicrobiaceae bacterium]|nr:MAG: phage portal protein [Hyphomicrobiaceae bacterium]